MEEVSNKVIRPTDKAAIRLGRTLLRTARVGALGVLEPETGIPLVSRVGVATDIDGAPLILVSLLSTHTRAILADPRCSLLLGQTGKGDPLAHPRVTLVCSACRLEPDTPSHARARRRYLNRNPKARIYADLGDFSIFRLQPERANLNGRFGKAYHLGLADLLTNSPALDTLADSEQAALDHMNTDHPEAVSAMANSFAATTKAGWVLTGIDAEGVDLVSGEETCRILFPAPLDGTTNLRKRLVELARQARRT